MRKSSPDSRSSARGEAGVPGEHCRPGQNPCMQLAWGPPPCCQTHGRSGHRHKVTREGPTRSYPEKNGFCVAQGTQSNRSSGSCSWSLTWVGHPQWGGNLGPQAGESDTESTLSFHFSESVRRLNIYWNTFYAPRHLQTDTMLIPKLRDDTQQSSSMLRWIRMRAVQHQGGLRLRQVLTLGEHMDKALSSHPH